MPVGLRVATFAGVSADASSPPPDYLGHRQRLRQRFLAGEGAGMPDYEILELILTGANPRGDVKPLAKELLRRFGTLGAVLSAAPERLAEVKGCGEAAVALLKATREAGLRLLRGELGDRPVIGHWQALIDYCRARLRHETNEQFRLIFLDVKNQVVADEQQSRGTIDHTPVYPREVARRALELGAAAVIMVHNHPSGDPTPSRADVEMTRQVAEALKTLGIAVHDHVVIGRDDWRSFRALGLL